MIKDNYELEVLVNGKPVKEYFHDSRFYIEGKKGTTYSLSVKNNGSRRLLVIPSVDGLNVLTGKEASFSDRGYIVGAYSSIVIDGWRTSDKEVRKFFFSNFSEAYAKNVKQGKNGKNIGVIGCAVFKEKEKYISPFVHNVKWIPNEIVEKYYGDVPQEKYAFYSRTVEYDSRSGSVNCSVNSNGNVQSSSFKLDGNKLQALGTGFGESKHSEIVNVEFEREDSPSAVFELFYNSREALEKLGINFVRPQYISPSAFPGESEYCQPPEI